MCPTFIQYFYLIPKLEMPLALSVVFAYDICAVCYRFCSDAACFQNVLTVKVGGSERVGREAEWRRAAKISESPASDAGYETQSA